MAIGKIADDASQGVSVRVWARLADARRRLPFVLTQALLFVLHFTVMGALAGVARLLGRDLFRAKKPEPGSYWLPRRPALHTIERARRPF